MDKKIYDIPKIIRIEYDSEDIICRSEIGPDPPGPGPNLSSDLNF